jgi:hypothetical protein
VTKQQWITLKIIYLFIICYTGVCTQDLALARQALTTSAMPPHFFALDIFWIGF